MSLPFVLPPMTSDGIPPVWLGNKFQVGSEFINVLQYSINHEGWNDDLTHLHEDSAGADHFIDRASREHAIHQLKTHLTNAAPTILEIGCSSGFLLREIKTAFPQATLIGADVVKEPLEKLAKELPTVPLMRFDLTKCPLPDNSIDAIVLL